jgi:tetratricopeptide (TPR) repeat protein
LNESSPGRIFISYRRQETAWPAGRLYDVLVEHFRAEQVFKDVDNIEPGEDFVERIAAAVGSCDVLLVLIGPHWLTITDEKGRPRLDDPQDFVRLEIETALTRKIRVIPILVDGAQMPRVDELPSALASLIRRNAVEINPLTFDTKRLIATVRKVLADLKVSDTAIGSASATSRARADRPSQQVAGPDVEQLYDQALGAFWSEQWDKAVDLLSQVLSRQPDYADAVRKLDLARAELAAEQQPAKLAADYHTALRLFDRGRWKEAVEALERVTRFDPTYQDAPALLDRARRELAQAAELAKQQARRQADEQARVLEEVQASQLAEVQAWRQAEKKRKSHRVLKSVLIGTAIAIFILIAIAVVKNIESNTPPSGALVFSDDFSSVASGWPNTKSDGAYYLNGGYRIRAKAKYSRWQGPEDLRVYPKADLNLRVDVETQTVEGADQGGYGVGCRANSNRFYAFEITESGSVKIEKVSEAGWSVLASSSFASNSGSPNKLQVTCSSSDGEEEKEVDLAVWVDGKRMLDAKDTGNPFTDGGVIIFADSYTASNGAIEAQFDNFSVFKI